jgi:hypothetical protein
MANAIRPIFIPTPESSKLVKGLDLQFEWFLGMARTQKQKSITAFHQKAEEVGYQKVLEISTYSLQPLGRQMSAFKLICNLGYDSGIVEELYQKGKVLSVDESTSISSEELKGKRPISFVFEGYQWPLNPQTCFYDWLYLNALNQNIELSKQIFEFSAFTDIAYNPKKSLSTQARSAALYVALKKLEKTEHISNPQNFLNLLNSYDYMRASENLFNLAD